MDFLKGKILTGPTRNWKMHLFLRDAANPSLGKTGITFDQISGFVDREGPTNPNQFSFATGVEKITRADAYETWGWFELGQGAYQFHYPNEGLEHGANSNLLILNAPGAVPYVERFFLEHPSASFWNLMTTAITRANLASYDGTLAGSVPKLSLINALQSYFIGV